MLIYRSIVNFSKDVYEKRNLIVALAYNDFKKKYANSYLGLFWSFFQPLINIGVFWFVFSVGFRTADIDGGVPYILWLICGLIPWYYFGDVFSTGSNVLYEYNYMLKQLVFRPIILPFIKIISNLFTHCFFILLIVIVIVAHNRSLSLYNLQVIYYLFCSVYYLIGLCLLFASLKVFLPDIGEIIAVILQLGVWITPIMWNLKMIPSSIRIIFKLNPMFYIIDGYRDSFIHEIWFWEKPMWTLVYFITSTSFIVLGVITFKKLQPHFNDIL